MSGKTQNHLQDRRRAIFTVPSAPYAAPSRATKVLHLNECSVMDTMRVTSTLPPAFRWAFNVRDWSPTREQFMFCLRCVQPQERQRILAFVFKKDVKPALVGRLMLRKCAAETLSLPYDSVIFNRSDKGKPVIEKSNESDISNGNGDEKFDLNVSHQGDYCVLASDACSKVGVDTMKVESRGGSNLEEYFRIMTRQFSPDEWAYIREPNCSDKTKMFRFMRLWTLKEGYVKAEGTGIYSDLQRISFECPTKSLSLSEVVTDTRLTVDGEHMPQWTFEESLLDDEHCVTAAFNEAVNANSGDRKYKLFKKLTYEELIVGAKPLDEPVDEEAWRIFYQKPETPR